MSMSKNRWLILAGVAALVFGGLAWVLWGEALRAMMEEVMAILREAGPVVFFGAMAVLPLAGFPLSPFTVAAGPVFGPQMGVGLVIGCAITAVAVNVTLSYWLAARVLRPLVMWGLAKLGRGLPAVATRSGWELTLVLRVVPGTPFFLQSYLLGVARVRFGIYLLISVAVPAVYITGVVLAGDALGRGDRRMLLIGGLVCAAVGAGMHLLRRRLKRRLGERQAAAAAENAG